MVARRRMLLICMVLLSLSLVGCLGGKGGGGGGPNYTYPGIIKGRVVDESGKGLPGASVALLDTPISVTTGANGEYQLFNIPPGNWSLLATKQGYRVQAFRASGLSAAAAGGKPFATDGSFDAMMAVALHVRVTVDTGAAEAPDIRMIAYEGAGDDVTVTAIQPPPHGTLPVGASETLHLTVYYSLESMPEANVGAALLAGSSALGYEVKSVATGKGSVSLQIPFTVPNAPFLTLQTVLFDDHGMLSEVTQSVFPIAGYKAPEAPKLKLESVGRSGVVLSWTIADPDNFERLEIYRTELAYGQPGPGSGDLVATFTDPSAITLTDTDVFLGETLYYAVWLLTKDGQWVSGAREDVLTVNTANPKRIVVDTGLQRVYALVQDPAHDRVYALYNSGAIAVLLPGASEMEHVIPVDCSDPSAALSPDGSVMFLACVHEYHLAMVDLATGDVAYIADVTRPTRVAYDPATGTLYAAARETTSGPYVLQYDVATGARTKLAIDAHGGLATVPDRRWLLTLAQGTGARVVLRDLDTLQVISEWDGGIGFLHPDGDVLFHELGIYSLPDGGRAGALPVAVSGISGDGQTLASLEGTQVTLYEWTGLAWTPFVILPVPNDPKVVLSLSYDGTQVYYGTQRAVEVLDLGEMLR